MLLRGQVERSQTPLAAAAAANACFTYVKVNDSRPALLLLTSPPPSTTTTTTSLRSSSSSQEGVMQSMRCILYAIKKGDGRNSEIPLLPPTLSSSSFALVQHGRPVPLFFFFFLAQLLFSALAVINEIARNHERPKNGGSTKSLSRRLRREGRSQNLTLPANRRLEEGAFPYLKDDVFCCIK